MTKHTNYVIEITEFKQNVVGPNTRIDEITYETREAALRTLGFKRDQLRDVYLDATSGPDSLIIRIKGDIWVYRIIENTVEILDSPAPRFEVKFGRTRTGHARTAFVRKAGEDERGWLAVKVVKADQMLKDGRAVLVGMEA